MPSKSITIICRERDKYGSHGTETYIAKHNATARDIGYFSLRAIYNMELEYYATCLEGTDNEILLKAKATRFREPLFEKI